MQLPFNPSQLAAIQKVPVASSVSVVTPVRDCWHVAKNGIQRHFSFVGETKVLAPGVDFFLTCRVPSHFASKRIGFRLPSICAFSHQSFHIVGFVRPAFPFSILKNLKDDVAFHQTQVYISNTPFSIGPATKHELRCLVSLFKVPAPLM